MLIMLFFFHCLHSLRCFTSVLLKSNVWLRSLRCFTSVLLKWNLWLRSVRFFVYTDYTHWFVLLRYDEMKISDYSHYAVLLSLLLKSNLWLRILHSFSSLTTLTTLFYVTTTEMKFLIALTTLFFFNDYTHYPVLFHYYWNEISDCAHYAVFLQWLHWLRCFDSLLFNWNLLLRSLCCFTSLLLKWNMGLHSLAVFLHWLHSLCCFTSLLLNGNLWLYSLRCVTVTTTKNKFVTLITTPFYFTTIKMKYLSTLTTLF